MTKSEIVIKNQTLSGRWRDSNFDGLSVGLNQRGIGINGNKFLAQSQMKGLVLQNYNIELTSGSVGSEHHTLQTKFPGADSASRTMSFKKSNCNFLLSPRRMVATSPRYAKLTGCPTFPICL